MQKNSPMRYLFALWLLLFSCWHTGMARSTADSSFYRADHPAIQLTGRIDYSDSTRPRFWAPGVYITLRFSGTYCIMQINDEERWGTSHNYVTVKVDDKPLRRIRMNAKENTISLASGLKKGSHTVVICKSTEAEIGYLQLIGFTCSRLLPPPAKPARKIEFIGNSITCGMGNDVSLMPCHTGEWYDQHNAYMAYGPLTARQLNAQWHLSSVSGIGLIHSCCDKTILMPQVFDKINMADNKMAWDFSRYQPDIVTVCLGQNDGIQDSSAFSSAYITFIDTLRKHYPAAMVILLNSPMASPQLDSVLKRYITAVKNEMLRKGDNQIFSCFFSKRYHKGCDSHPDAAEHQAMADELTRFIKKEVASRLPEW